MKIWRKIKFFWQKRTIDFTDQDLWNLDVTVAEFVLPRLKRFKKITKGHPADLMEEEWDEMLDEMIGALEEYLKDPYGVGGLEDAEAIRIRDKKITEGMNLFARRWMSLWY